MGAQSPTMSARGGAVLGPVREMGAGSQTNEGKHK